MEAFEGEGGGEIDGGGGLADSAFLIDDGENLGGWLRVDWLLGGGFGFAGGLFGDHRGKCKGIGSWKPWQWQMVVQKWWELWRTCGMLVSRRNQGSFARGNVEIFVPRGTFIEASCAQKNAVLSRRNGDRPDGG